MENIQQQQKDLKFFCWQLKIETMQQLQKFKNKYKIKDTKTLLQKLAREYNGKTYNKINFKEI
jgi:hypothetical protein